MRPTRPTRAASSWKGRAGKEAPPQPAILLCPGKQSWGWGQQLQQALPSVCPHPTPPPAAAAGQGFTSWPPPAGQGKRRSLPLAHHGGGKLPPSRPSRLRKKGLCPCSHPPSCPSSGLSPRPTRKDPFPPQAPSSRLLLSLWIAQPLSGPRQLRLGCSQNLSLDLQVLNNQAECTALPCGGQF